MKMTQSEARQRLAEIIAGKQPEALAAIESVFADIGEPSFENWTVADLTKYMIEYADEIDPFWR